MRTVRGRRPLGVGTRRRRAGGRRRDDVFDRERLRVDSAGAVTAAASRRGAARRAGRRPRQGFRSRSHAGAVRGGPGVAGRGGGGAVEAYEHRDRVALPGEPGGEPAVAEEGADLRPCLRCAAHGLDAAAEHPETVAGDGLDAEVDPGADPDRRGVVARQVQHGHQGVLRIGHALQRRHVRAGRDDRARPGEEGGHPATGHRAHGPVSLSVRTVSTGVPGSTDRPSATRTSVTCPATGLCRR